MSAAPPVRSHAARTVVLETLEWVFALAGEIVGSHAPWEMDAELDALEAIHKVLSKTLVSLPKEQLVVLGRALHALVESRDFEIAQLETDYRENESEGR
jgi:hypothetical protein